MGKARVLPGIDPWKDPHLFERVKCNLCARCFREKGTERCIYGGPFSAYVKAEK